MLDILHLCLHKIYTLILPSSFAAGRRMRPCQLHMTAGKDALVSKSAENSPQRGTCWLLEAAFAATGLRRALFSLLLPSPSSCPYPRLQSDHWRMPASCYSHFLGPHVGSLKTVTDQRLQGRNVSGYPKPWLVPLKGIRGHESPGTFGNSFLRSLEFLIPSLEYNFLSFPLLLRQKTFTSIDHELYFWERNGYPFKVDFISFLGFSLRLLPP